MENEKIEKKMVPPLLRWKREEGERGKEKEKGE